MTRTTETRAPNAIFITGGSGGIGSAIARRTAPLFDLVILQYRSNREAAEAAASSIRSLGTHAHIVRADLASTSAVDSLASDVEDLLNSTGHTLRALVNNAGLLLGPRMFEVTADDFDMFMAVNARAPLLLTQRLGSRMLSGGSIVNVSSMGAQFSSPGDIVYAMSKAALESLTLHAAQAFATRGIRINTVIPGFTDNGNPAFADPRTLAYMSGYSSLGGVAQADAVADGVAFLVSDASRRTTGASLDVSGGGLLGSHPNRIAGSVHAGSD